jgi:hypothetical protein
MSVMAILHQQSVCGRTEAGTADSPEWARFDASSKTSGSKCVPRCGLGQELVERENSQRCECMRLNFTNMWARRTSATVWRTPSIGLRSCTLRWRSKYQLGPPGAEEVPMNRGGSRHQRVPTPSTGNRNRIALQISEGKYGPHKIGGAELLKSPFIQLW